MNAARTNGGETSGGKRIFIVEDEPLIRLLLEDMLQDLGYAVAAEATRIDEALQFARTGAFDLAILDVNVNGKDTAAVADVLAARGRPFVIVTGYGPHGLPPAHRGRPTLMKPFERESLKRMVAAAIAQSAE